MTNETMQSYVDNLLSARTRCQLAGSYLVENGVTIEKMLQLNLGEEAISLWQIYEVVISLHILPNKRKRHIKRVLKKVLLLLKSNFKIRNDCKASCKGTVDIEKTIDKGICFLGFTDYLARENYDVLGEKLNTDGQYKPIFISDKKGMNKSVFQNIDVRDICFDENLYNIKRYKIDANKKVQELFRTVERQNISFQLKSDILRGLSFIKEEISGEIIEQLVKAHHLLIRLRPVALISIDVANPACRIFTLLANKLSIPVVQIQSGPISFECTEWSFCYDDLILTHGKSEKEVLMQLGVDAEKITSTGSSKLEKVATRSQKLSLEKLNYDSEAESKVKILFLTSYTGLFKTQKVLSNQLDIYLDVCKAVISLIGKQKRLSLTVKPHPLEKRREILRYKKLASPYSNIKIVDKSENTIDLIHSADVVISFGSTATIDAIFADKLVICPNFKDFVLNEHFEKSKVIKPKDFAELNHILQQLNNGETKVLQHSKEELKAHFVSSYQNGNLNASNTIRDEIYKIISMKYHA